MQEKIKKINQYMSTPVALNGRIAIIIAALLLLPSLITPLWKLNFGAQQYPEGLELFIYPDKMVGGDDGNDLTEINVLNHYIGMDELRQEDFAEFKWIPLIIGLMFVLSLRAAVVGTLLSLVDILVFMGYFAAFSLWRFWSMLSSYGHSLDLRAAVQVQPFTPPIFGSKMVGQFSVTSYPSIGGLFFFLFIVLILLAVFFTVKSKKSKFDTTI